MAGKLSMQMHKALAMYRDGYKIADSARKFGVTVRGLRYALVKQKKIKIDRRK